MKYRHCIGLAFAMGLAGSGIAIAQERPGTSNALQVQDDGTIVTPAFELPFSSFASPEAQASFVKRVRTPMQIVQDIAQARKNSDERLEPMLADLKQRYPVTIARSKLGGVTVDTFLPTGGVDPKNQGRVLLHMHGGGFVAGGGGIAAAIESVPIASLGRIRVVSVDYRLAPENRFPAASEDVAAVYRELLKTYRPENIGLYGCSAGGMLAGQSIAWFLKEGLPLPGAVGIFCASLHTFAEGDSAQLWTRMGSILPIVPPRKPAGTFGREMAYMAGQEVDNPLVVPGSSDEVMRRFPPTLFMTGTRAPEASGAAQSHLELLDLGVDSQLLLFDGLDHGFHSDPNLPESVRAYRLVAHFFNEHLGRAKAPSRKR